VVEHRCTIEEQTQQIQYFREVSNGPPASLKQVQKNVVKGSSCCG
jgi:hypothetical protein